MSKKRLVVAIALGLLLSACATTESSRTVEVGKVESASAAYRGPRIGMVVGKFDNRSNFMRGMFSDGVDRLGGQAKTVLISHLQQSQRFNVMDRENMAETQQESQFKGQTQNIRGADFVVSGGVSEFGRKEVGDQQLFGILGRGKSQIAYAKVTLSVVNSQTSEIIYSAQGAGEYSLSAREVVGFGSAASYDSTLNGKVLDLAIREAVNRIVSGLESGAWSAPTGTKQ